MFKDLIRLLQQSLKIMALILFFCGLTAQAKVFRNAYVSFEMSDSWKCALEHTEWVCRSEIDKESKEAIIILTAKEVGPTDSFEAYTQHLASPQSNSARTGGVPSKVMYAPKRLQINDHPWIDGLHLASEVPNYYTRYLATIKDKIAVLVTLSAHTDYYKKYSTDFFKTVMSLRVIASKNLLSGPDTAIRPGSEVIGAPINGAIPGDMVGIAPESGMKSSGGGKTKAMLIAVALILVALAGYIFWKSQKK